MAELEEPLTRSSNRKPVPELGSPRPTPPDPHETRIFPIGFLSKAASFVLFVALLVAVPSQAPEFVNQTLLTRSWELLHLLLVGIAVSYGLFSRCNADPASDKEAVNRTETPRSYVSQLLQVSSVFDDDEEDEACWVHDGNKLQMWSSQYCRPEPKVVVEPGGVIADSSAGRPLLLPIRSLRSRIPDDESPGEDGGPALRSRSFRGSGFENGKVGEVGPLDSPSLKGSLTDGAVHPSPIPWRSRSGRMEARDETGTAAPPPCSLPPSAAVADTDTMRSPPFHPPSSRSNSAASSPRRLSRSPSLSPEMRAKTGEDSGRKKTLYKAPPPPPPPPPPPSFCHKPPYPSAERKDATMSFKDELKDFGGRNGGRDRTVGDGDPGSRSSRSDSKPRIPVEGYSLGKSVRTVRPAKETDRFPATAIRDQVPQSPPSPAYAYQNEEEEEEPKKEVNGFVDDGVIIETEDSDSDASDVGDFPSPAAAAAKDADENEVDKKADEFIAKFREQIRQQRIESIRKSAGQRGLVNASR